VIINRANYRNKGPLAKGRLQALYQAYIKRRPCSLGAGRDSDNEITRIRPHAHHAPVSRRPRPRRSTTRKRPHGLPTDPQAVPSSYRPHKGPATVLYVPGAAPADAGRHTFATLAHARSSKLPQVVAHLDGLFAFRAASTFLSISSMNASASRECLPSRAHGANLESRRSKQKKPAACRS
jgi:hypothetical protein